MREILFTRTTPYVFIISDDSDTRFENTSFDIFKGSALMMRGTPTTIGRKFTDKDVTYAPFKTSLLPKYRFNSRF